MVVTETELEEKIIPLLVLFFVCQMCTDLCLVMQIAGVTFSGVPFCHSQVVVWCTLSLVLAQHSFICNAFFGNSAVFP